MNLIYRLTTLLVTCLSCFFFLLCIFFEICLGWQPDDFHVSTKDSHPIERSGTVKFQNIEENTRRRIESYVLKWTNQERKKRSLPILKTNLFLGKLAQIHSRNQAESGMMAHDSEKFPEGWRTFEERMKKLRFVPPVTFGENVFWSSAGPPHGASEQNDYARRMVQAWMTSEDHRKNILNAKFARMGVGILSGYVTQLFASQDPNE